MIALDLKVNDEQQEIIKNYLQENVSDILAEKINKGINIIKNNTPLVSKKDLDGFMEYACKRAQEQAEKGKRSAVVKDDVVFGWAIHYFEEDSIEGTLYNPDGTKYEPPKTKSSCNVTASEGEASKPTVLVTTPPVKKDIQLNMFDLFNSDEERVVSEKEKKSECGNGKEISEEKQETMDLLIKEELENVIKKTDEIMEMRE